jgi:hypothetical protein
MLLGPGAGALDPGSEEISPRSPTAAELAVAERVLRAAPPGLLYARVDLIPGPDGSPLLAELELTEPTLFLMEAAGSAVRLAEEILTRLR